MKKLTMIASIALENFERRDLLFSVYGIKCSDCYENAAKRVLSTADFMIDAALDLLLKVQSTNEVVEKYKYELSVLADHQ